MSLYWPLFARQYWPLLAYTGLCALSPAPRPCFSLLLPDFDPALGKLEQILVGLLYRLTRKTHTNPSLYTVSKAALASKARGSSVSGGSPTLPCCAPTYT